MKEFTLSKVYQLLELGPGGSADDRSKVLVNNIRRYNLDKHLLPKYTHD
jgi:hypothetical protein